MQAKAKHSDDSFSIAGRRRLIMKAATISANPITIAMKTERNDILSSLRAVNCQWNFERYPIKELPYNIMNKEATQKVLLRLTGAVEMLAFIAVVMPRTWMEISHEWLGLGQMPHGPVLMFLIRQASYTYGMHGIALWVLAFDVKRFRPLIILNGIAYLLAAPVFWAIDYTAGMPLWWTIGDCIGCGVLGAALLWCSLSGLRVSRVCGANSPGA